MLASAAIIGLSLTAGHAAEVPLPPQVNFVATPANQLRLGMTGDEVVRVMGKAAKETDFAIGSARIRKLEFTDEIPGQVILSNGKLSHVTLDPFRMQEAALPSQTIWMADMMWTPPRLAGDDDTEAGRDAPCGRLALLGHGLHRFPRLLQNCRRSRLRRAAVERWLGRIRHI